MPFKTIEARFIGEDGSLGYRHGDVYKLVVKWDDPRYPVVIRRHLGTGYCPYSSMEAFERNWELEERG